MGKQKFEADNIQGNTITQKNSAFSPQTLFSRNAKRKETM
jgi:hypothetical protein